jgi:hypothetical protein
MEADVLAYEIVEIAMPSRISMQPELHMMSLHQAFTSALLQDCFKAPARIQSL